jgi:probable addiction module antidote protein
MIKSTPYRSLLLEDLADTHEAAHYLCEALEDSPEMFKKAVQNVARAHQVTRVAREAGIQRETLYRSFSTEGNPTLDTLLSVLGVLKLKIEIVAAEGAEFAALPTVVPQARLDAAPRVGRNRRALRLQNMGQLPLPFESASAGRITNAGAYTFARSIAQSITASVSNAHYEVFSDEYARPINQESGGLPGFIPAALYSGGSENAIRP